MKKNTGAGRFNRLMTTAQRSRRALIESERARYTLMDNLGGMVYRCRNDAHWTMEFVSDGCIALTGFRPEELVMNAAISYESITHPADRAMVRRKIESALRRQSRFFVEYRVVARDGTIKHVWERGIGIYQKDGMLVAIEGFVEDVSERHRAFDAIRDAEERYRGIFENAIEGIFQSTPDGRYLSVNPALARIYGYDSPHELMDELADISTQLYVNDRRREEFTRLLQHQGRISNFVSEVRTRSGNTIWISENARAVRDTDGSLLYYEGTVENITETMRVQERLQYQATHDTLTDLPNRTLLLDRLDQAIERARRSDELVAVVFVDLDNFKLVNDSLGHHVGDELLVTMSQRMRQCVRAADTVARQGGDEFVLVLSATNAGGVEITVNRLLEAVCTPWQSGKRELRTTCSIGVSLFPLDGDDPMTLLKYADLAMYRSKEAGRNGVSYFRPEMLSAVVQRLDLEQNLRQAIERQQFTLHYQPRLDLATHAVIGMEALLRWTTAAGTSIPPTEFVPVAEETGLIVPIGDWVLCEACRFNAALTDPALRDLVVSVNLSARQFHEPGLVERVADILSRTGLPAHRLELEITENVAMHDMELVVRKFEDFARLGVHLSIDDFGTGYSNLSYLKRLPVGRLKIDQAFVRDITTDADDAAIVRAVISLGQSLGIRVVAEGVENPAQLQFLSDNGCDEVQGFHFGRPEADCDFTNHVKRHYDALSLRPLSLRPL